MNLQKSEYKWYIGEMILENISKECRRITVFEQDFIDGFGGGFCVSIEKS